MKVVARRGEGSHEVVVELSMSREQAEDVYGHAGRLNEDQEEMVADTLNEHLKGLRRCQRIRMTPHYRFRS